MTPPEPTPPAGRRLEGVVFVTGNADKAAEARRVCGGELQSVDLDLPEVQALDLEIVLRAKGEEAFRRLQRPLIVEETGLELAALNGFPGPLVKWMLQAVGPQGIARSAAALGDRRATARCLLLLLDGRRQRIASGVTRGQVVLPPRGDGGFGWDSIFEPEETGRTYAEISGDEKDRLSHRGRAWRDLLDQLRSGS